MISKNDILLDDLCYFINDSSQIQYGQVIALFSDGVVYLDHIDGKIETQENLSIKNCDNIFHAPINNITLEFLGFSLKNNQYIKTINDYIIVIDEKDENQSYIQNLETNEYLPLHYIFGMEKINNTIHSLRHAVNKLIGCEIISEK